jgi:hypothetical protein
MTEQASSDGETVWKKSVLTLNKARKKTNENGTRSNAQKKYKRDHGDCLVPARETPNQFDDKELSFWVGYQRTDYKRGTIPNHRI